ncbi:MAG: hypothetical protein ACI4F4_08975 [Lachnospiraceae bacterium]
MNIFKVITGNIVKWWQFTVMPILRIDNNRAGGYMQETQNATGPMKEEEKNNGQAVSMGQKANSAASSNVNQSQNDVAVKEPQKNETPKEHNQTELTDAELIMERLNREQEEQRKKTLEKAQEEAKLAAIMNANKVDVNAFIQAGKEARDVHADKPSSDTNGTNSSSADEDAIARAEEIIARLNREAAEDEAKKAAEIEAAKQKAKETFGV